MADRPAPRTGPSAVLASLPVPPGPDIEADWPGVDDPEALRDVVARWLAGYGSAQTRRTYAYALGLPVSWADTVTGAAAGDRPAGAARPPAAPRGPLHHLRHAYVTIALENGARIQHVQADVGHASLATTQHYDRGLRRREASAADLVSEAIHGPIDRTVVEHGERAGSGDIATPPEDQ